MIHLLHDPQYPSHPLSSANARVRVGRGKGVPMTVMPWQKFLWSIVHISACSLVKNSDFAYTNRYYASDLTICQDGMRHTTPLAACHRL